MDTVKKQFTKVQNGEWDERLTKIYGATALEKERYRYTWALERYAKTYGWGRKIRMFSIPACVCIGKAEKNVFSAVTSDMLVIVSDNGTNIFRIRSHGYSGEENTDYYHPGPYREECGTMAALVRGLITAFKVYGYEVYGVDAYAFTEVFPEMEMFSYEVFLATLATVYNFIFNEGKIPPMHLAEVVKWVGKNYFQKELDEEVYLAALLGGTIISEVAGTEKEYAILQEILPYTIYKVSSQSFSTEKELKDNCKISDIDSALQSVSDATKIAWYKEASLAKNELSEAVFKELDEPACPDIIDTPVGGASVWRMRQNIFSYTKLFFVPLSEEEKLEATLTNEKLIAEKIAPRKYGAVELSDSVSEMNQN